MQGYFASWRLLNTMYHPLILKRKTLFSKLSLIQITLNGTWDFKPEDFLRRLNDSSRCNSRSYTLTQCGSANSSCPLLVQLQGMWIILSWCITSPIFHDCVSLILVVLVSFLGYAPLGGSKIPIGWLGLPLSLFYFLRKWRPNLI